MHVRVLWLSLAIYLIFFVSYAWRDLYAPQTTIGLYSTHHSPYKHALGYVIDPKPTASLADEMSRRLHTNQIPQLSSWQDASRTLGHRVIEKRVRPPAKDEILLAQDHEGTLLLILNEYLGQWVTFRPKIGILLESKTLEDISRQALVLRSDDR